MAPIILHLLLFLVYPLHIAQSTSWVQTQISNPTQNLTKLHFFFHDIVAGQERSVAVIAKRENSTSLGFGTLVMIDDPLTVGPDRKSKLIGRAQGMYGIASQTDPILQMTMTFGFIEGSYKGSSISILGRYNVADQQREMPIIGGSGVFRLARGYAIAKPFKPSVRDGEDTAEYNVFVLHSDTSSMF